MNDIQDIHLEFLRAGPAHNQLLSPLAPYMALCGADGPVMVHLPFEHAQLLNRLNRLRYEVGGVPVAASQRQAELQELGDAIGRVLGKIPALVSALRCARADTSRLVNIQLKISAFELGLVPFEATMAPADTSGSGAPLLLRTLTSMTREIRRGEPLKFEWNRAPKILFAFASPPDLPAVPAQAHLEALRRAIDPWVKIKDSRADSVVEVGKLLTVLKNASARSISDACQADDYTHVHILAHGAPLPNAENRRFGVVLAQEGDPNGSVVVDGQSLAMALKSMNSNGRAKAPPTVVTLATCDSGNTDSVLTPGGSIAHELHAQDIPWVIASQFPLWMEASNRFAEVLYRGLLAGDDPRWALHQVRQRLRIDLPDTHDWASIVAYAAIAPDLDLQVDAFRTRQTKRSMEIKFDRMDELAGQNEADAAKRKARDAKAGSALDTLCLAIRASLAAWSDGLGAQRDAKERAERKGMQGASEKRIAIAYELFSQPAPGSAASTGPSDPRGANGGGAAPAAPSAAATPAAPDASAAYRIASTEAYRRSREFYAAALKAEPTNHWVMTQFLSISATPALAADAAALDALRLRYGRWWLVARQLAEWQLHGAAVNDRVWAHGTLAELELLGAVYAGESFDTGKAQEAIADHCRQIRELASPDPFPAFSTQRQFRRYTDQWARPEWAPLAQAALAALESQATG